MRSKSTIPKEDGANLVAKSILDTYLYSVDPVPQVPGKSAGIALVDRIIQVHIYLEYCNTDLEIL